MAATNGLLFGIERLERCVKDVLVSHLVLIGCQLDVAGEQTRQQQVARLAQVGDLLGERGKLAVNRLEVLRGCHDERRRRA